MEFRRLVGTHTPESEHLRHEHRTTTGATDRTSTGRQTDPLEDLASDEVLCCEDPETGWFWFSDESDETDTERVKDEQVGTYFYLPEGQRDELRYRYKMLSTEYERKLSEDLEKNRHFYPLLVSSETLLGERLITLGGDPPTVAYPHTRHS